MSTAQELRVSVGWSAGIGHERRRVSDMLRQRATLLQQLPGPTPRAVVTELRRLADQIEETA